MSALHDLLNLPRYTCGAPVDSRVWVSTYHEGAFYSECPDCFEAREGVADIGDYAPHVTVYPADAPPVRMKAKRRKRPAVSSDQMGLWG